MSSLVKLVSAFGDNQKPRKDTDTNVSNHHVTNLLHSLMGDDHGKDVTIISSEGEHVRFHSSLLAVHSEFLRGLFLDCFPRQGYAQIHLSLPETPTAALNTLSEVLYMSNAPSQRKDRHQLKSLMWLLQIELPDQSGIASDPLDTELREENEISMCEQFDDKSWFENQQDIITDTSDQDQFNSTRNVSDETFWQCRQESEKKKEKAQQMMGKSGTLRKPLPSCSPETCRKKCSLIFSDDRRQEICNEFYSVNFRYNRYWLKKYMIWNKEGPKRFSKAAKSKGRMQRQCFYFHLPLSKDSDETIPVCQKFFASTLGKNSNSLGHLYKVMASDKVEPKKVGKYERKHAKLLTESILRHLRSYENHAMPKTKQQVLEEYNKNCPKELRCGKTKFNKEYNFFFKKTIQTSQHGNAEQEDD